MLFCPSCGYDGPLLQRSRCCPACGGRVPSSPSVLGELPSSSLFWRPPPQRARPHPSTHIHWEVGLTLVWSDVPPSNFQRLESKKALKCKNPRAESCRAGFLTSPFSMGLFTLSSISLNLEQSLQTFLFLRSLQHYCWLVQLPRLGFSNFTFDLSFWEAF